MPKKSNITQRSDGRWMGRAVVGGKRRTVYGKTQREADQKLRELVAAADKGMQPPSERLTVSQWFERWLEHVVKPAKRPSTYRSYEQNYRCYIEPALGGRKLTQLLAPDLRAMYAEMTSRDLSAHSVRRCHAVLHTALEQALADNLVHRNVARGLKGLPPARSKQEVRVLTPEQVRSLLEAAKGARYHALFTLALYTALRQGELLGLRWEDVDLDAGTLSVRQSLGLGKRTGPPKSASGTRSMQLPQACITALREHRTDQNIARLRAGEQWTDTGLVFTTYKAGATRQPKDGVVVEYKTLPGSPLTQSVVDRALKSLLAKAGLPTLRFHELRHTACSLMALQGVPATVAMKRMGHSDIRLTLGHYTHVLEAQDRDAAAKLDALLA